MFVLVSAFMFMPLTYQAPWMRVSWNVTVTCPGLTPVLCSIMREYSVVPDTWTSLALAVAFDPVTWAAVTLTGVPG
jgi:hypothetical protein